MSGLSDDEKRARFEAALRYGGNTHNVEDVVQMVREDRARYWPNGDGSIVTELVQYPNFKSIRYWLISGCLKDCLALDPEISEWAISEGCTIAEAGGRRGWGRAGAPYGWKLHGYTFYKVLQP